MGETTSGREALDAEVEAFRQLVVEARSSSLVEAEANRSLERLDAFFFVSPELFTEGDVRFVNALAGFLEDRLEAHRTRREPHGGSLPRGC